jgi:Protein of unknown function (DUF4240)
MPENRFWALIDASQPFGQGQPERLEKSLQPLDCPERLAFDLTFFKLREAAYRWDVWGAAYVYAGGCSDDSFMDFRAGLIGLGQAAYEAALADPDSLADQTPRLSDDNFLMAEDFGGVSSRALRDGTCTEPRQADLKPLTQDLGAGPPEWDFDDEHEMQRRYPRLWAMYGDSEQ